MKLCVCVGCVGCVWEEEEEEEKRRQEKIGKEGLQGAIVFMRACVRGSNLRLAHSSLQLVHFSPQLGENGG